MSTRVVAIVGSYRRGGITDSAVQAILEGAREKGAETHTIYLTDLHLEFCKNCRECSQKPGPERGQCTQLDDLEPILTQIEAAEGRKPGKKEKREIKDDVRLQLLPMAFTKQAAVQVWIDPKARLLVLDAASQAKQSIAFEVLGAAK